MQNEILHNIRIWNHEANLETEYSEDVLMEGWWQRVNYVMDFIAFLGKSAKGKIVKSNMLLIVTGEA